MKHKTKDNLRQSILDRSKLLQFNGNHTGARLQIFLVLLEITQTLSLVSHGICILRGRKTPLTFLLTLGQFLLLKGSQPNTIAHSDTSFPANTYFQLIF